MGKTIGQSKQPPLISICIINYNSESYLADCINSITAQTYPNIEIVFCDDASTDGSVELFESIIKNYPRIKVNRQYSDTNIGVEKNMLKGLRTFSGEYVCNVDCDDVLLPNHLTTLYSLLERSNSDIACTNHIEFFDGDPPQSRLPENYSVDLGQLTIYDTKDAIETFYLKNQVLPFAYWHRLHKRKFAKKVAGLHDKLFQNSDSAFSVAQFLEATTVSYLDTPTYLYRVRDESMSHRSWYAYTLSKTLGSLDNISEHYSSRFPYLAELNDYRNAKSLAWALDSCINEGLGYREFYRCYKEHVNHKNRGHVLGLLTEHSGHKKLSRALIRFNPILYYLYKRKFFY